MKVSTGWHEVSLEKFANMQDALTENSEESAISLLAALADCSIEEIESLPIGEVSELVKKSEWALDPPPLEFEKSFVIDGVKYAIVPDLNRLTLGEHHNMETYTSDEGTTRNLHKILALLYRPVVRKGIFKKENGIEDYDSNTSPARAEIFRKKLTVKQAYGACVFFSLFATAFMSVTPDSSDLLQQLMENLSKERAQQKKESDSLKMLTR